MSKACSLWLAVVLILIAPAIAEANSVRIVAPGSGPQVIDLADRAGQEDIRDRSYTLRSANNEREVQITGFSLWKLLRDAGISASAFDFIKVNGPNGNSVLLTRDHVTSGSAFPEGPPVIYTEGNATSFLRPAFSSSDRGNAADSFRADSGDIELQLQVDQSLGVRIKASPTSADPGQEITFSPTVSGSSGQSLTFNWSFGDGSRSSTKRPSHVFKSKGSHLVELTVTSADGRVGTAMVQVTIGKPDRQADKPKKPKKKRPRKETQPPSGSPDSGGTPGPTGYGPSSPVGPGQTVGPATQTQPDQSPEEKEQAQPQNTGQVVTGVLVDPETGAPISPISPDELPEPEPDEPKGNATLSDEVLSGLGIAGLLLTGIGLEAFGRRRTILR